MQTIVYCVPTDNNRLSFFLRIGKKEYFLFSRTYRRGVSDYFCKGVDIDTAMDHSRAHDNTALLRTMDKLPSHLRYIETEYGVRVMRRSK